ncbi:MAG: V-type ATPase 116kDa subunit family protein [Bacteroidales bacterium]|nr:V-type ATPase 116kDa subunit family protein [Bacteroidales bacterium]MDD3890780.1 V-type ATPase 116kDa subunit family protein [Bacteroidales bacterium]
MIVPMIKYGFLVYHRDFDSFLNRLQEMGLVDVERHTKVLSDEERNLINEINRYTQTLKDLKNRTAQNDQTGQVAPLNSDAVLDEFEDLVKEKEQVESSIRRAQKDLNDVRPWGNFNIDLLRKLSNSGLSIKFYVTNEKAFDESLLEDLTVEIIKNEAGQVYFVWIQQADQDSSLPIEAVEVKIPNYSASGKEAEIATHRGRISEIENRLNELTRFVVQLEATKDELVNQLEINSVTLSAEKQAEDKVLILTGWVPKPKNDEFVKFIEQESIIYVSERAKREDNAPILLKNNRFARLFEPIGSLFTNPIYGELDLTPLFAPFFMMFFGFCLGDAGYGLVMLLGAAIFKHKVNKKMRPILSLVQWLALATIIFGMITGTFFGIELVNVEIPFIQKFKNMFLDQNQLFALALIVGAIQIVFGMFVKAANEIRLWGWMYSITTFSWLLLILGSGAFYGLSMLEGANVEFMGLTHKIILGVAAIGILFFNSPGKNPFVNFGLGLWGVYNMVTGLFGDILSYIRLFALGLSSAILGNVFNSLAFGMAPDIPVVGAIVTILILVAGHSINLFMAALGSLVHPMRLIFVEFYKNAGFIGGGKTYQPFEKKIKQSV